MTQLNWKSLVYGSFTASQIAIAIGSAEWQTFRVSLLGSSLIFKYEQLCQWITQGPGNARIREIQVTNYVNALKRGGLIK
jgi:hypothetical protein